MRLRAFAVSKCSDQPVDMSCLIGAHPVYGSKAIHTPKADAKANHALWLGPMLKNVFARRTSPGVYKYNMHNMDKVWG